MAYPLSSLTDGSGDLVVATTRPETMMGDTGVAVNPEDDALSGHLVGKTCILPLMNREIPIVADEYVEMELRHRLREDDPCTRPQRLRGGPAPQPGDHPGPG
ncbi:MAG: hypothetical protein ACLT3D_01305 [Lawsonibacter sp.]